MMAIRFKSAKSSSSVVTQKLLFVGDDEGARGLHDRHVRRMQDRSAKVSQTGALPFSDHRMDIADHSSNSFEEIRPRHVEVCQRSRFTSSFLPRKLSSF